MKMLNQISTQSGYSHEIDVLLAQVDIADWLFNPSEVEYQPCCMPDHTAVGATTADDGQRMSIDVEMIGTP